MKFYSGQLIATRSVNDLIVDNDKFAKLVYASVKRHTDGDWGDACDEDSETNDWALQNNERLVSVYKQEGFPTIWIITERDRSVTTVLFPEEY